MNAEDDLLVMLDGGHLKGVRTVYHGQAGRRPERALSYQLAGLTHKLRIRPWDVQCAFRYFTDNLYDASEMRSDHILIKRGSEFLDFYVPNREAVQQ